MEAELRQAFQALDDVEVLLDRRQPERPLDPPRESRTFVKRRRLKEEIIEVVLSD